MNEPINFYVSPAGSDAWSGRLAEPNSKKTDGPLATIPKAQELVRDLKTAGRLSGPVTVYLREGRYPLVKPLVFTPQDSGPITYAAYPGEKPILDAGRRITGWEIQNSGPGTVWVAQLPEVARGKWFFRQLFVNGRRRQRPRLPKKDFYWMDSVPGFDLTAELFDGTDSFCCAPGNIQNWHNLTDVDVVVLHWWTEDRLPIASFDEKTRTVTSSRRSMFALKDDIEPKYARYFVENVFEALTEPGEWYLDRKTGELFYLPVPGETPETAEVYAPVLDRFLTLAGKPEKSTYVEFLRFQGLEFQHADWHLPLGGSEKSEEESILPKVNYGASAQAACNLPGAISMVGARNCGFENCRISHIGLYAFDLGDGCVANRLIGNEITDLGAGGIKLCGSDAEGPLCRRTGNNIITDNHIHSGGWVFPSGVGVLSMHAFGNEISHNHIHHLFYSGISCGWVWGYRDNVSKNNRIEKNHIHHIGQGLLADMGGIYTLGVQPGTVLRGNLIHDIEARRYGWAIYLDEASSHLLIEDNICYNTSSLIYHQNSVRSNIVRNNIFAFGNLAQVGFARGAAKESDDLGNFLTFEKNIVLTAGQPVVLSFVDRMLDCPGFFCDLNLYWDITGQPILSGSGYLKLERPFTLGAWRAAGFDRHSIIADPRFKDVKKFDFTLPDDSPALALGFRPIDTADVGPRNENK